MELFILIITNKDFSGYLNTTIFFITKVVHSYKKGDAEIFYPPLLLHVQINNHAYIWHIGDMDNDP